MEFHYTTSDLVFCRRTELTLARISKINYYYKHAALPLVTLPAGIVLLFTTHYDLFALWVMLMAGSFLAKVKPYDRLYREICYPAGTDGTTMPVTLHLARDGMKEEVMGVSSFAPWGSVVDAVIMEDLLMIRLSSKQQALIPRRPVGMPELNLEEIRDHILRLKEATAGDTSRE